MYLRPLVWLCFFVFGLGTVSAQVVAPRVSGIGGGGQFDLGQPVVLAPGYTTVGTPPLQYIWRKNGVEISGQVAARLVIEAAEASDAATYTLVVRNSAGSSSGSAEVTVRPAAEPVITRDPRSVSVEVGQSAAFNFTATGSYPRTHQWRKDGVDLPGATNSTLVVNPATAADVGTYSVQVRNSLGVAVSAAGGLTVNAARPLVMGTFPREAGPTVQGRSATFSAPVSSGSTPYTYQWRKAGVPIAGATDSTLVFDGITLADAGTYSVVVANVLGTVTSPNLTVTVEPAAPPFQVRLPTPPALIGSSFEIQDTQSLFEKQPTLYQWYKDGRPLAQETTSSHKVSPIDLSHAGDYFVVATNVAGSTTSTTARIAPTATYNSAWRVAERDGDIVYFSFANPARIERFDLAGDTWLPTLQLARTPTAMTVHNGLLHVAFGPVISRFALDGTGEAAVASGFLNEITGLCAWGGFLFASDGNGGVTTLRLSDGAKVSTTGYSVSLHRPVVIEGAGQLVGRHSSSFGGLTLMQIQSDGSLRRLDSRAQLGELASGARAMVSPDEQHIAMENGSVFDTVNREFLGSVGSSLDDMGWVGNREPVVLRAGTLHFYGANFHETHRLSTDFVGRRLFIRGGDAFIFGALDAAGRPTRKRVVLADAQALQDPAPLSPERLGFTPDKVLVDRDGVVLLYSKLHRQIFRWSTAERRFLASIPVRDWLDHVAYSAAHHRLYLGHPDGRLTQVRLDIGATAAEPFATVPPPIRSIATAGEFLRVNFTSSSSSANQLFFDREARPFYVGSDYSIDSTWNAAKRRLYYFRDSSSPNDLLYMDIKPDGTVDVRRDSPYHGEISAVYPIRVSTDGSRVLLGSGKFFDGDSLAVVGSLPHAIQDAQWVGSRVVTARVTARGIEVQRWSGANYELDRTVVLAGRLMGLLALPGDRVGAVTTVNGVVHISVLNQELALISADSVGAPRRLINIATRSSVGQGDQTLIPGFVITGSDPKTVLIRAVGPGLRDFGIVRAIADPSFTVYDATGTAVGTNDNWSSGSNTTFLSTVSPRAGAFPLGRGSRDAAALMTLAPGAYTVHVQGVGDAAGVALVEVYDTQDNHGSGRLINVATRGFVGTGEDIMIAGVVVESDRPKTLLVRAVGPSLAAFGVGGLLANPRLRVFRDGELIAENDDWGRGDATTPEQISSASARTGAFSLLADSRDAALVLELAAGSYSVQVSGVDDGTGVALVEIYEMP